MGGGRSREIKKLDLLLVDFGECNAFEEILVRSHHDPIVIHRHAVFEGGWAVE